MTEVQLDQPAAKILRKPEFSKKSDSNLIQSLYHRQRISQVIEMLRITCEDNN